MTRFLYLLLSFASIALGPSVGATDDLSGAHECALYSDYHPCTLTSLPGGGYALKQSGRESFEGTLTPKGEVLHLEGTYKFAEGTEASLSGDLRRSDAGLGGRVKAGTTPITVDIRPAKIAGKHPAKPALASALAVMTNAEAVTAGSKLPLKIRYFDAPKLSFTVKAIDEKVWDEKLSGVFGMVPAGNNAGIECSDAKLSCKLTANSGADVWFRFTRTADGFKLTRIELPAEGD